MSRDFCYADPVRADAPHLQNVRGVAEGSELGVDLRQGKKIYSAMVAIFAAAVAVGTSGCWMAAAQFAPIAANVAESVGAGAVELVSGIGASAHHQSDLEKKEEDARASAMNSDDSCNQLEVEVPGVIELRRSAAGAAEYRELLIVDSLDQRQWAPTPDGWQPAVNFLQMNFSPPLGAVVPENASNFLAYAPSKFVSQADADRLTAMTSNFGKPAGTFIWKGQYFHYVVTSTLPCFPPPPELVPKLADSAAPSAR